LVEQSTDTEEVCMSLNDIPIETIDGRPTTFGEYAGPAVLVVNVASRCGLTPQYTALEQLQEKYGDEGFTVLGFPSNQFGGQEPGTADEIQEFCSTTYGVSFPLTAKVDVNGPERHPMYAELTKTADADGWTGDIRWNFEKFLVSPQGDVVARFRPKTTPDDPSVIAAIESVLTTS
jgi:glutathione peroxidase